MIKEIDDFLFRNSMKPTTLGKLALGDPRLYEDIKRGRELRHSTKIKILEFMEFYDQENR